MASAYSFFEVEKLEHNVAIVWLNSAENKNAMNWTFWQELPVVMQELNEDEEINCIIIAGKGKSFSIGLDIENVGRKLKSLFSVDNAESRWQLKQLISKLQQAVSSIEDCSKPVIAAIQGHCLGGAVDLISACDFRYCSKNARFSILEVKVGIVADVGSLQRLPYIIGEGPLRELAFSGEIISSSKAKDINLVNSVYDNFEQLMSNVQKVAKEIAQNSKFVVRGIKHVLNQRRAGDINRQLNYISTFNSSFLNSETFVKVVNERLAPNEK